MKPEKTQQKLLTEHKEQVTYFDWVTIMEAIDFRFENIFAIPNDGKRSYALANYYIKAGLHSGVPDIFIAWPSFDSRYAGAFLETKRSDGGAGLSRKQIAWKERILRAKVYSHSVCNGADQLIKRTKEHFGI